MLDKNQLKAAKFKNGVMMVLAGPGSGKTTVITHRIKYLIESGVDPQEILVITFTRKAAESMQERFELMMSANAAATAVNFGTFHSVFFRIIKNYMNLPADCLITDKEKNKIISEICKEAGIMKNYDQDVVDAMAGLISAVKNKITPVSIYSTSNIQYVQRKYDRIKKEIDKIDFDDMMILTEQLFKKRPDVLSRYQEKYKYIMIDEFQDINPLQFDIVRMLTGNNENLFVVGDDDQSIYAFRGSSPEIMLNFKKHYPATETTYLSVNYRSKESIINGSSNLIKNNNKRFKKNITGKDTGKGSFLFKIFNTQLEENDYIAEYIKKTQEENPHRSIAILVRKHTDANLLLENLKLSNINTKAWDNADTIYNNQYAQAIIRFIKRAMNGNRKYMPQANVIPKLTPCVAINYALNSLGDLRENEKSKNIIEKLKKDAAGFSKIPDWLTYIEKERRGERENKIKQENNSKKNSLHIMTMHASKGLEFDIVIIPQANEGIVPHPKALTKDEIEEERRLFYVAQTRAKEKLIITAHKSLEGKKQGVSRFVQESLE